MCISVVQQLIKESGVRSMQLFFSHKNNAFYKIETTFIAFIKERGVGLAILR